MCELTANEVQTINPGESAIFTTVAVPCTQGFVRYRLGTGNILLSGWMPAGSCPRKNPNYFVDFGANIAIPTGQTVGPISVALSLDGSTVVASQMIVTPAAVEQYFNVSRAMNVSVFRNCCETITVRNTSSIPILMQNANIVIDR